MELEGDRLIADALEFHLVEVFSYTLSRLGTFENRVMHEIEAVSKAAALLVANVAAEVIAKAMSGSGLATTSAPW